MGHNTSMGQKNHITDLKRHGTDDLCIVYYDIENKQKCNLLQL